MHIGLFLAYYPWFTPEEQIKLSVIGDEEGLDSTWLAEAWGIDCVTMMATVAAKTERIGVGSAIMQMPARQPAAAAMAAASLDIVSNGRVRIGLGPSGPQVSEGWYGVPFEKPAKRTREYVEVMRKALSHEELTYDGEFFKLPTEDGIGLGKPLKLLAKPVQQRIPIYLGAIGPMSVRQAGQIADGWLPFMVAPEHAESVFAPLHEGIEKAGRKRSDVEVLCALQVAVDEDPAVAREAVRPLVAFYLGSMGSKEKNFYVDLVGEYGFEAEAKACQEAALVGDNASAAAALSPELLDTVAIACTPEELPERLERYRAAGADGIIAVPCGHKEGTVKALAAAKRELG